MILFDYNTVVSNRIHRDVVEFNKLEQLYMEVL